MGCCNNKEQAANVKNSIVAVVPSDKNGVVRLDSESSINEGGPNPVENLELIYQNKNAPEGPRLQASD